MLSSLICGIPARALASQVLFDSGGGSGTQVMTASSHPSGPIAGDGSIDLPEAGVGLCSCSRAMGITLPWLPGLLRCSRTGAANSTLPTYSNIVENSHGHVATVSRRQTATISDHLKSLENFSDTTQHEKGPFEEAAQTNNP